MKFYSRRLLFIILIIIIGTLYMITTKFVLNRIVSQVSPDEFFINNANEQGIRCIV